MVFTSPETHPQLIDSSSECCRIGLLACPSERTSDCFGGARFSLPIRAQLGLCFLRASASMALCLSNPIPPRRRRGMSSVFPHLLRLLSRKPSTAFLYSAGAVE